MPGSNMSCRSLQVNHGSAYTLSRYGSTDSNQLTCVVDTNMKTPIVSAVARSLVKGSP
ncbi:hypothetical protein JMJ78_0000880 [Colletotrichum scovillei]|nr:hypothetical protein JMJ78_0000880 [Colletotrichum scovillei]